MRNIGTYKVHVIDVGYCMEVGYAEKYREETQQHAEVMRRLRAAGYADVQLHLLIFGNMGRNFQLMASHVGQLGIAKQAAIAAKSLFGKLHFHALKRLEQNVRTRRPLGHEPAQTQNKGGE